MQNTTPSRKSSSKRAPAIGPARRKTPLPSPKDRNRRPKTSNESNPALERNSPTRSAGRYDADGTRVVDGPSHHLIGPFADDEPVVGRQRDVGIRAGFD